MAARTDWGPLWEEASERFEKQRAQFQDQGKLFSKLHKKKSTNAATPDEFAEPKTTEAYTAAFNHAIDRRRDDFSAMRDTKGRAIGDTLMKIAQPLRMLMDQASAVAGMFFPGTPMIYSGVLYLLDACKGVSGYFDVVEQLMEQCQKFLRIIAINVDKRGVQAELKHVVVECLVRFLDICRITTAAVKEKRLKAWFQQLCFDKSGEARVALQALEKLAQEHDSTVGALTLTSVENIASDVTEVKGYVVDIKGDVVDVKVDVGGIRVDLARFSAEQREQNRMQQEFMTQMARSRKSEPPADSKSAIKNPKVAREKKLKEELKSFLRPDESTVDRFNELRSTTTPGTCQWVFDEPKFKDWTTTEDSAILIITGPSGFGKSHVAASIVENVRNLMLGGEDGNMRHSYASYFCDFDFEETDEDAKAEAQEGPPDMTLANSTENEKVTNLIEVVEMDEHGDEPLAPPKSAIIIEGNGNEKHVKEVGPATYPSHIHEEEHDETQALSLWELESEVEEEPSGILFFLSRMLEKRPVEKMFRALAWRLTEVDKTYETFLMSTKLKDYSPKVLYRSLFLNAHFARNGSFLVIDSLDRLDSRDRQLFYKFLRDISRTTSPDQTSSQLKVVVLGRPFVATEIFQAGGTSAIQHIAISENENRKDIETYASLAFASAKKFRSIQGRNGNLLSILAKEVSDAARGGFELATFLVKEMLYKDHLDIFSGPSSQPSVPDIIRRNLQQFGMTHELQDIEDFNRLLAWVIYGKSEISRIEELNAIAVLDSPLGGFIDLREKIERDFSQYLIVADADSREVPDARLAKEEKATVRLTHSSISKYFKGSQVVDIPGRNIAIGVRKNAAEVAITKTCLLALCNTETRSQTEHLHTDLQPIIDYAVTHLGTHLNAITWFYDSLEIDDKVFLGSHLTRLAKEETLWRRFWFSNGTFKGRHPDWYSTSEVGSLLVFWRFVSDADVVEHLTAEEQEWSATDGVTVRETLLLPVARFLAAEWLQNGAFDGSETQLILYLDTMINFLKASTDEVKEEPQKLTEEDSLDAPLLISLAEWAGFEKDAKWYTHLAWAIGMKNIAEAKNRYQTAIDLDSKYGPAYSGMAFLHAKQERYEEAIAFMRQAIRHGCHKPLDPEAGADHSNTVYVAEWQEKLLDYDGALMTLNRDLEFADCPPNTAVRAIGIAFKIQRYKEVMNILRGPNIELSHFLYDIGQEGTDRITIAAHKTKQVSWLKSRFEEAITFKRGEKIVYEPGIFQLTSALCRLLAQNQEFDVAIERMRDEVGYSEAKIQEGWDNARFRGQYCNLQLSKAEISTVHSPEYNDCVSEIKRIEKREHIIPAAEGQPTISTDNFHAGLFLSTLLSQDGKPEEADVYLKERMQTARFMLYDENLNNDGDAYQMLFLTLLTHGDDLNAAAAASIFSQEFKGIVESEDDDEGESVADKVGGVGAEQGVPTTADENTTLEAITLGALEHADAPIKPVTIVAPGWDYGYCDGLCMHQFSEIPQPAYYCSSCYNTWFCENCVQLLEADGFPYKKCDPDHHRVKFMGFPPELNQTQVLVDGVVRDREEWLDSIWEQWGLPKGELWTGPKRVRKAKTGCVVM